jgi:glycosyltransferase involved in cell wall biosynthesis
MTAETNPETNPTGGAHTHDGTRPATPEITVVVCSYNGARRIGATLHALLGQHTTRHWELLVVDDGSTDATATIARDLGVRVVTEGRNLGLSAARNLGIAAASSPVIAFTDDDVVPTPLWVESLAAAWGRAEPTTLGIGGTTEALDLDSFARRYVATNNPLAPLEHARGGVIARLLRYLGQPDPPRGRRTVDSLVGANMSFRTSTLRELGGFDPVIRFGGDEEDLCRRIREARGPESLIVEPQIGVLHDFDKTLRDTLRRARAYGRGNGRDWARRGGIPAIRPMPVLLLAGCLAGLVAPKVIPWILLGLPAAIHRKVLRRGLRRHGPEALLYPYTALAQELYTTAGFVEEARAQRKPPQNPTPSAQ